MPTKIPLEREYAFVLSCLQSSLNSGGKVSQRKLQPYLCLVWTGFISNFESPGTNLSFHRLRLTSMPLRGNIIPLPPVPSNAFAAVRSRQALLQMNLKKMGKTVTWQLLPVLSFLQSQWVVSRLAYIFQDCSASLYWWILSVFWRTSCFMS